jgi:hypothetical protein
MAQILVVKPKSLTLADKKLLRAAGVVCIETADPANVRLIQPEGSALNGDELFYAAIQAISRGADATTRRHFTDTLARLMEQHLTPAAREQEQVPHGPR